VLFAERGDEDDRDVTPRSDQRPEAMTGDLRELDVDEREVG